MRQVKSGTRDCACAESSKCKGTQFLLDSLEQLRTIGIPFELCLVERVDRVKAIELYRSADIVADQFVMGAYGVFALETIAKDELVAMWGG